MADRPRLRAPAGACDCHMHFYDTEERYPVAPTAAFLPPPATVADYREIQARLGLERVVVVQPSAYGTDNRCTMDAVTELGEAARAVVVVDRSADHGVLERLTKDGARGIRFHMFRGGVLPWEILEEMAARVHEYGWHVQLQCNGRELPEREAMLRRLPGTLVIDHIGRFQDPVAPDHPAFRTLLGLLESGRVWIKLSAPYESSRLGPPRYEDVGRLARALVKAAPERMLWATNWPHPGQTDPRVRDEVVALDLLLEWVPDEATRDRILVDNPAALYGF
ncbi:MAG TPA: amidohydrolase family protein [Geminicoccaceae bacterium]|nr:amidohydrolase family protein [Geminicoccaceae bacterium]